MRIEVTKALNDVSDTYQGLDRHEKALKYFEQALTIKQARHKREEDHADVGVALSDVASASSFVELYKNPLALLAIAY